MTEDEQWAQINYPSFFGAIGDKITAAKTAMDGVPVAAADTSDWLETNVNEVPILWRLEGDDCFIHVGVKSNGDTFYSLQVPYQWLTA